jgi:glycopeptide antibiotics resistance protein
MNYLNTIESAFIYFPFIAFLFTIPFMIHEYRKYGSIPKLRIAIIYSFILYLMCAYFLVILPLPDRKSVALLTTPRVQLIPFSFIKDIIERLDFSNTQLFIKSIPNISLLQALFNICLVIPFGIYMHYYFKQDMKHTILYSFLLSLFFELTQLSGLYFIYPRGYRLFDVDDLMLNTLGGFVGYEISCAIGKTLPSRDDIDKYAVKKGKHITFVRRTLSFCIDLPFFVFIALVDDFNLYQTNDFIRLLLAVIIYYGVFMSFTHGKTIGCYLTGLKVVKKDDKDASFPHYLLRYFIFYFVFMLTPYYIMWINSSFEGTIGFILALCTIIYYIYVIIHTIHFIVTGKEFWYEKFSNTKLISVSKELKKSK